MASRTFGDHIGGLGDIRDGLNQIVENEKDAIINPFQRDNLINEVEPDTGVPIVIRAAERYHSIQREVINTSNTTQVTLPTNFAQPNQIRFVVKRDLGIGYFKDIKLKITLTETSGTGTVTPLNLWFLFTNITIWANLGKDKVQVLLPETMFQYFLTYFNDVQRRCIEKNLNITAPNYQNETTITAGGSKTYYLPLFGNWFESSGGFYLPALAQGDEIWLELNTRQTPVKSSTGAGALGLGNLTLIFDELILPTAAENEVSALWMGNTLERNYIDTYQYTLGSASEVFTNSTDYVRQLTALRGKVAAWLMVARTTPSTYTANAHLKATDLGSHLNNFKLQFETLAGRIITGTIPLWPDYMRTFSAAKLFPGVWWEIFKNWYIIPFGDLMAAEDQAIRNGWWPFTGDEVMRLTPGAAGLEIPEVVNLTNMANISAGNYSLIVNGRQLPKTYTYTTTGTTLAADINTYCLFDTVGYDGTPILCAGDAGHFDGNTTGMNLTFTNVPKGGFSVAGRGVSFVSGGLASGGTASVIVSVTTFSTPQSGAPTLSTTAQTLDIFVKYYRHCHVVRGKIVIFQPEPFSG